MDSIDRQAAIDHWRSIIDATDGGDRYDIGFNDGLEFCISDLSTMPSAQPTLYGYEIEHLAYIARVMQKEGVTAEYAVRTFDDMTRMSRMIIEELQEKVEKSLSAMQLPSAEPERLTDDDFETIRIHLNAYKEKLCNQQRWKEAEEYQRIIDRFMAFAYAQPERKTARWIHKGGGSFICSDCGEMVGLNTYRSERACEIFLYCPHCGAYMGEDEE